MEIAEIRKMANISRAEMCRKYGIPVRTAEDWENGKGNAPQYLKELLERAVRQDYGMPCTYYVTVFQNGGDEWIELKTMNKMNAIQKARDVRYIFERDGIKDKSIEIRLYAENIEDEDCACFDYDTIDF